MTDKPPQRAGISRKHISLILFFGFMGLLVFTMMGGDAMITRALAPLSGGTQAEGVVTNIGSHGTWDNPTYYAPIISFTDGDGTAHEFESKRQSKEVVFLKGAHVQVSYDPADPESTAEITALSLALTTKTIFRAGQIVFVILFAFGFVGGYMKQFTRRV